MASSSSPTTSAFVAGVADRIALMYAGRVVEEADVRTCTRAAHPYARACSPRCRASTYAPGTDPDQGRPPNLAAIPSGCPFHPRCPRARDPLFE